MRYQLPVARRAFGVIETIILLACIAACTSIASASSFTNVTDQSLFTSTDTVHWSGSPGVPFGATFTSTSDGGVTVAGAFVPPGGTLQTASWWGSPSLATSGNILYDGNSHETLNLFMGGAVGSGLTQAVSGLGIGIQSDTGGTFTAQITGYNASGNVLTSFTKTSDANGDAVFLGILDSDPQLAGIRVELLGLGGFAVNSLQINSADAMQPTAEGSSLLLVGTGMTALGFWRRRRKTSPASQDLGISENRTTASLANLASFAGQSQAIGAEGLSCVQ